jgi:threonine/homoserine/homoserine lactone efflux protein
MNRLFVLSLLLVVSFGLLSVLVLGPYAFYVIVFVVGALLVWLGLGVIKALSRRLKGA